MAVPELVPAASALTQAEFAEQPAEKFLGAHLAALRVAAVVLAHRTEPRRAAPSTRPRDVWQVLADVAPEYAEWAGFFAASALKRRAVQAGAVNLVGTREADDLLRDVRLFHDQVARRLVRVSQGPTGAVAAS
ncbi:MAG TPA: SAV_6107 family HEPN domain-containing protein [Micropruina sp.]|nr:SAV_6107 family HEPN domain-containing protein [Micropruina sp.]